MILLILLILVLVIWGGARLLYRAFKSAGLYHNEKLWTRGYRGRR